MKKIVLLSIIFISFSLLAKQYDPIINAARGGNLSDIEKCVSQGSNVNVEDNLGRTPLMLVDNIKVDELINIYSYLIKNGANVDAKDKSGKTLLMLLVARKRLSQDNILKVIQFLVEDKKANIFLKDKKGLTAFRHAVINNRNFIADYLDYKMKKSKKNKIN